MIFSCISVYIYFLFFFFAFLADLSSCFGVVLLMKAKSEINACGQRHQQRPQLITVRRSKLELDLV